MKEFHLLVLCIQRAKENRHLDPNKPKSSKKPDESDEIDSDDSSVEAIARSEWGRT